jgi:hypothetical protein
LDQKDLENKTRKFWQEERAVLRFSAKSKEFDLCCANLHPKQS